MDIIMKHEYIKPAQEGITICYEPCLLAASSATAVSPQSAQQKQYFCPFLKYDFEPSQEFFCKKYSDHMNEWADAVAYIAKKRIKTVLYTGGDDCKEYDCPVYLLWKKYDDLKKAQMASSQNNNGK